MSGKPLTAAEGKDLLLQQEMHRRTLLALRLMHGLSVDQGQHVLNEAARLLGQANMCDNRGPGMAEMLRLYEAEYGPLEGSAN